MNARVDGCVPRVLGGRDIWPEHVPLTYRPAQDAFPPDAYTRRVDRGGHRILRERHRPRHGPREGRPQYASSRRITSSMSTTLFVDSWNACRAALGSSLIHASTTSTSCFLCRRACDGFGTALLGFGRQTRPGQYRSKQEVVAIPVRLSVHLPKLRYDLPVVDAGSWYPFTETKECWAFRAA